MTIWERYSNEEREEYIKFLQVYGALSNLFRQKHGDLIPYLDSKFQETVFARVFKGENVDIGNTPHDILSVFGDDRIGIGLKTWMNSKPSFQKVMQLKRYKNEIILLNGKGQEEELAYKISSIKNDRMERDHERLGLNKEKNIYHYITRDEGKFNILECTYPLVDLNNLRDFKKTDTSFLWSDGQKSYKYTFGDSQIWQQFDSEKKDTFLLNQFNVDIIDDPFEFLIKSYFEFLNDFSKNDTDDIVEVFLPLYSYRKKEVEEKSGLNAWNAAPKTRGSDRLRPLNEIYIPIPREFHTKYPDFFVNDIFSFERSQNNFVGEHKNKPQVRFHLQLPNGKRIPALVTQSNMKGLQSGSQTEIDPETNRKYGQSALGQWLLVDVLGLKERQLVTLEWLRKVGTDSVRLWHKKGDYSLINIDFAPIGSFERFINEENEELEE